jgi:hypothetical protein
VGRSDRTVAFERASRRLERTLSAVTPEKSRGDGSATRSVLVATLRQQALFLTARRDRETALRAATALTRLDPKDEVAAQVNKRFAEHAELAQRAP